MIQPKVAIRASDLKTLLRAVQDLDPKPIPNSWSFSFISLPDGSHCFQASLRFNSPNLNPSPLNQNPDDPDIPF